MKRGGLAKPPGPRPPHQRPGHKCPGWQQRPVNGASSRLQRAPLRSPGIYARANRQPPPYPAPAPSPPATRNPRSGDGSPAAASARHPPRGRRGRAAAAPAPGRTAGRSPRRSPSPPPGNPRWPQRAPAAPARRRPHGTWCAAQGGGPPDPGRRGGGPPGRRRPAAAPPRRCGRPGWWGPPGTGTTRTALPPTGHPRSRPGAQEPGWGSGARRPGPRDRELPGDRSGPGRSRGTARWWRGSRDPGRPATGGDRRRRRAGPAWRRRGLAAGRAGPRAPRRAR